MIGSGVLACYEFAAANRRARSGALTAFLLVAIAPIPAAAGQPAVFAKSGRVPAVEIQGCYLAQGGQAVTGDPPVLRVGVPLDIAFDLKPVGVAPQGAQLRIIIRGPGWGPAPSFLKTYPLETNDLPFGCVAPWSCSLELPRRIFVGDGTLTVAQIAPDEPARDWAVLYATPVRVPAVAWASGVGNEVFARLYGAEHVRLGRSFRLAPATSVVIPVPHPVETAPVLLGIVSAYRYDEAAEQGMRVCRIDLIDAAGETRETVYLECGVSTAYDLHDTVPPTRPPRRAAHPIETAFTEPAPGQGEGVVKRHYAGRVPLSGRLIPATLKFTYLHNTGVLDVDDVVLITADPEEVSP